MLTNELNISIFGIRRGGNHAIIHWLAAHFDEPVWFVNDIKDFNDPKPISNDTGATELPEYVDDPGSIKEMWEIPKKVLFQSYEDRDISHLDVEANERVVGTSGKRKFILILRDPFNTFASRFVNPGPVFTVNKPAMNRWKQYAREALGLTHFIPDVITINYNSWFKSERYRRRLERLLELPACDDGMGRVFGVGSSFSRKEMDGKADKMKVEDRWQSCRQAAPYRKVFRDQEVWALSNRLFGPMAKGFRPKPAYHQGKAGSLKGARLVYIRTPKTGSTTFKEAMRQMGEAEGLKILYLFHQDIYAPSVHGPFDLSLHHVVYNEGNAARLRNLLPKCHFITSVRTPVEQARSEYNHIGPKQGHVNKFAKNGMSFSEWYMKHKDDEGERCGWRLPVETRHWGNGTMGNFTGFRNLDFTYEDFANRYAFVLVAEQFDLSLRVLEVLMDCELKKGDDLRVAQYDKDEIPPEVVEAYNARNAVDCMVYDFGRRRLGEQAKELGL